MSDAPAATALALEGRGVSAGYVGGGGAVTILSGVSFGVAAGGRLVLLGRSGSGKSTLLRLCNRLDEPIAGTILVGGRAVSELDPLALRRRVALVAQTPIAFAGTVRDNLLTRARGAPAPADERLAASLEDVGLDPGFLSRAAESLSVGERQRMCLARALVSDPEVLLLDEPTSALDPKSLAVVADLILSLLARRSLATVTATHQPELVRRLGGPTLLLDGGRARTSVSAADLEDYLEGR